MPEYFTSGQVAKRLRIPVTTLSTYISVGKLSKPKSIKTGEMTIYLWTEEEIERVRKLLPKIKNGRKTRYQTQKGKSQKPQPRASVPHEQHKKKK